MAAMLLEKEPILVKSCDELLLIEQGLHERARALADRYKQFEHLSERTVQEKHHLGMSILRTEYSIKIGQGRSDYHKIKHRRESMLCIWQKYLDKLERELMVEESQFSQSILIDEEAVLVKKIKDLRKELETAKKLAIAEYVQFRDKLQTTGTEREKLIEEIRSTFAELTGLVQEASTQTSRGRREENGDCSPKLKYLGPLSECPVGIETNIPDLKSPEALEMGTKLTNEFGPDIKLSVEHGKFVTVVSKKIENDITVPPSSADSSNAEMTIGIGFGKTAWQSYRGAVKCAWKQQFYEPVQCELQGETGEEVTETDE